MKNIIIGTRKSQLALWQANFIKSELEKYFPELSIELKHIVSKGDKILDKSLDKIGDKGLFTKELENELLAGTIDIAVHSLKDLQTELPAGLKLAAITKRHNPEDVLISRKQGEIIQALPEEGTIATGSLRRRAQLANLRPDINIVDLRGNVNTRIQKFLDSDWDGIILARAGVERLHLDKHISSIIDVKTIVPAVGQAALGIEVSEKNKEISNIVEKLNHSATAVCCNCERAFLAKLGSGCQIPAAAHALIVDDMVHLDALIASIDGKTIIRESMSSKIEGALQMGSEMADLLLKSGGNKILNI